MRVLSPIAIDEIRAALPRIADLAIRTPLVRLQHEEAPAEIWLKLENLQPIGSFKVRGAGNAVHGTDARQLADGVYTPSAGNMGQGVAFVARALGAPCTVVVPDHAPRTKIDAIERYGARVVKVPFDTWWQVLVTRHFDGLAGTFIHPVSDPAVIAGNGTIGLEIAEDLPDVDAVVVPYGGGGLSCGIASALRRGRWRTSRASSTALAASRSCQRCGRWCASCCTTRSSSACGRRQTPCGTWSSVIASWPKAPGLRRWPRR
jgi:threonine dehydratase